MIKLTLTLAALTIAASSANAAILFSENFDADTPALNSSLAQFTVAGQVDTVASGTFGITCPGNCLDLDGTSGPGAITSTPIFFLAGRPVIVSFDLSGNQRDGNIDDFVAQVFFTPPNGGTAGFISGPASFDPGYLNMLNGVPYVEGIAGNRPFLTYSYTFTAAISGSFQLYFGTTSGDNVGPILDNVLVTGSVPEPATWGLMIVGFGMVGFAARRRRTAVAA